MRDDTDWDAIVALYDRLLAMTVSPVVALNRAVAVSQALGAEAGLVVLDGLGAELEGYHAFHASRAEILRRAGDREAAAEEFRKALEASSNTAERRLIEDKLGLLADTDG